MIFSSNEIGCADCSGDVGRRGAGGIDVVVWGPVEGSDRGDFVRVEDGGGTRWRLFLVNEREDGFADPKAG